MNNLNQKSILITGGTGTFGKQCMQTIINKFKPKKLVIFSRDEQKQFQLSKHFPTSRFQVPNQHFCVIFRNFSNI